MKTVIVFVVKNDQDPSLGTGRFRFLLEDVKGRTLITAERCFKDGLGKDAWVPDILGSYGPLWLGWIFDRLLKVGRTRNLHDTDDAAIIDLGEMVISNEAATAQ